MVETMMVAYPNNQKVWSQSIKCTTEYTIKSKYKAFNPHYCGRSGIPIYTYLLKPYSKASLVNDPNKLFNYRL